jgi:hypothetical protein
VERHPRRAGGGAHLQAAQPHVLHRLIINKARACTLSPRDHPTAI